MNKKGFTLIELLAVIVILAIIALIATPIILNIISDSKEESNKRSVEFYGKAVEQAIAKFQLNGSEIPAGDYTTTDGKTLTKDNISFEVQYSGSEVKCTINKLYEDGSIYLAGCRVGSDTKEYTYGKEIVAKLCKANTTQAQAYVYKSGNKPLQISSYVLGNVGLIKTSESDAYATGVAYTCNFIDDNESNNMTFFVLSESGENVTLISGSNLGETVEWSEDGRNHKDDSEDQQAVTAKAALADRTANWNKLTTEQKATIKLPTKAQIEGAYTGSMPKWLYSHTTDNVASGYWTASPFADYSETVWYVHYGGIVDFLNVDYAGNFGVRPVITLSKSSIN